VLFREAGIIEKYGSGIQRITNAFISYGLQEPVFEEFQNGFRVTVFNNSNNNTNNLGINEGLNEGLNSMLTAIIHNPGIQAKQLSDILGARPLKTIERQIKSLTDKGHIERKGSKKTGGYWPVKN
jgi:ATP-dependent DNA helicase RecG